MNNISIAVIQRREAIAYYTTHSAKSLFDFIAALFEHVQITRHMFGHMFFHAFEASRPILVGTPLVGRSQSIGNYWCELAVCITLRSCDDLAQCRDQVHERCLVVTKLLS